MRDVLENLKKLPPECSAIINDQAVLIKRGAGYAPMFGIGKTTVDRWNAERGVSPQQVQAMIVGVTLGWDKDGADPDTHAEDLGEEKGPFTYSMVASLAFSIETTQPSVEAALKEGRRIAENLCDRVCFDMGEGAVLAVEGLDLIETTDPHA